MKWILAILALILAVGSCGISAGVAASVLTEGDVGLATETMDMAGILVVLAGLVLLSARRSDR